MRQTITTAPTTTPAPRRWLDPARSTGLAYLGIAVTGALGFLVVRPVVFDAGDPAATLAAIVDREALARLGVALELGVVATQALAALAFHRLLRGVGSLAAGALAAFGMVNAVLLLVSAGAMHLAVDVATGAVVVADPASTAQGALALSGAMWEVGNLFFGLWLIPMGLLARRAPTMPSLLGSILVVGGVGYVLAAFVSAFVGGAGAWTDLLAGPATVGELWMIGHLLRGGEAPVAA